MLSTVLMVCLILLSLALLGSIYRLIKGPSTADRVIALDTIGITMIALVAVLSMYLKTSAFLEVILLIGILTFIGTVAFAKFIERGVVLDRKRDH
ncbi:Na(+)/H(+) antiporter subunit F1 [Bacillus suaedae]|uniref:Na(+)/H(+) antiporter subunit F1 n=1 Tax=Halalkalibacter suaedae TaxID=2822140 RepID=A0A940WVY9_9BACI|nr:Na(+)/H(+) antiporter subunit F1 [Bacillus suaedae]MBP3951348.1 Na(+)/H(+) antiporter subunit F1 [Bacillus suaedae]